MIQIAAPKFVKIEADRYTPVVNIESLSDITVRVEHSIHARNVYWQLVDTDFSLLELGFDISTGRLVSCSIPLFNGVLNKHDTAIESVGSLGTPIFDMEPWKSEAVSKIEPNPVIKIPGRIQLDQYANALEIKIIDGQIETNVISGGKLGYCFGVSGLLYSINLLGVAGPPKTKNGTAGKQQ